MQGLRQWVRGSGSPDLDQGGQVRDEGMTSLEDWPLFTWSFGCTSFEPSSPPMISLALFAITSFAFMFVDVPDPVWKMSMEIRVPSAVATRARRRIAFERADQQTQPLVMGAGFLHQPQRPQKVRKRSP